MIEVNSQPLTGSPWRVHVSHRYKRLFSFGSFGKGEGRFATPSGIAINDTTGNIAVADSENNRVQLFSSEGKHLKTISAKDLIQPTSVGFTGSGDLIVIAIYKIFRFNESGKFVKHITNKHLKLPYQLTIARDGRMVVSDRGDNAVKVLTPDGSQLLLTINDPDRGLPHCAVCHQDMFVVSCSYVPNVKIFSKDGVFLYSIDGPGSGAEEQLNFPSGLTTDRFSNLVVCHTSRLKRFTIDGKLVGTAEGLLVPWSAAVSNNGRLFVTDVEKHCVYVFE